MPKSKRSRRVIESDDDEEENRELDTSMEKKRAKKQNDDDEVEAESNLETSTTLDESRLDDTLNTSVVVVSF